MKNTDWFVIVNPMAGGGKAQKHWARIAILLQQADLHYLYAFSTQRGHCTELAKQAIEAGYRNLAVVGGDGTAHEVINGICTQTHVPTQDITFAIIPVGTGNDWIRTHQIPRAYPQAIALIKAGNTTLQDIGKIDYCDLESKESRTRYFFNVAGMGYDAFVTRATLRRNRWLSNTLFYFYLILRCTFQYRSQRARIVANDTATEMPIYSMAMGICRYNGGGAQFVPHALPNDGLLAITVVKPVSIWEVVINSPLFYNGRIAQHPKVQTFQTTQITIQSLDEEPIWVEADGEFLGGTSVEMNILPNALRIVVP